MGDSSGGLAMTSFFRVEATICRSGADSVIKLLEWGWVDFGIFSLGGTREFLDRAGVFDTDFCTVFDTVFDLHILVDGKY